ncbi:MAG: mechanosensitive ion channel family protein [Chloroflexi bacterium]|nr:mechanosensitive ion channel family protein [Chloroflexota bacterium]
MDLSQFFTDVSQNAQDNFAWLALWTVPALLAIAAVWIWLPRMVARSLRWLDDLLPGDFTHLQKPAGRITAFLATILIVGIASSALVTGLGGDVASSQDVFRDVGKSILSGILRIGPKIALVIIGGLLLQRLASRAIPRIVEAQIRSRSDDRLHVEVEKDILTLSSVLTGAATLVITSGTFFMLMGQVGVNLAPLLVAFGVVGIAVGFGAQNLVRDLFAGMFIVLENQYRVNDVVTLVGIGGLVEDINLRRTVLRDLDYRQHFIPNGEIRTATNFTKGKSRVNMNIGVAYKEDLDRVIGVLNRVGQELSADPEWGPLILDPIKVLRVDEFADSAVQIKVLGETVPIRQWDIAGQYRLRVKRAFDEAGIEIPFPHRTLYWGQGEPNTMAVRTAGGSVAPEPGVVGGVPTSGPESVDPRTGAGRR